LDLIFPLIYKLLNNVNWIGTLISLNLIKAVLKQPCKLVNNPFYLYLNIVTRITQNVLDWLEPLALIILKNLLKTRKR
jgi:hypothetical protein